MKKFRTDALTTRFTVSGRNLATFINRLNKSGVNVICAEPYGDDLSLVIPSADCEKLFAICEDMCYNIIIDRKNTPPNIRKSRITVKKIKDGGPAAPAVRFARRWGCIVGLALFLAFAVLTDGILWGYTLSDVPAESRTGVMRSLKENGAVVGARFSGLDTAALERAIVKDNADVSFATVQKKGVYLVVKTLSFGSATAEGEGDITSPVDGKVVKIAVLRGTPLVSVGDDVTEGQVLVGAYYNAGEESFSTSPKAEITLQTEFTLVFNFSQEGEYFKSAAVAVTKEKCPFSNVIGQNVDVVPGEGGFVYTVTLTCLEEIGG